MPIHLSTCLAKKVAFNQWRIYIGYERHAHARALFWRERKSSLAKIKFCDLQFLQPIFCAPYNN